MTAKNLQIELLKFLLTQPKKQFAPMQLAGILQVENNRHSLEHALYQLTLAGSVKEYKDGKYGVALERLTMPDDTPPKPVFQKTEKTMPLQRRPAANQQKMIEGRVDMTRTGAAYIVSEGKEADVYVPVKSMNTAV